MARTWAGWRRKREMEQEQEQEQGYLDEQEQKQWVEGYRAQVRRNQRRWVGIYATMALGWTGCYAYWTWEQHQRPWQRKWHAEMHGVLEAITIQTLDATTATCMLACATMLLHVYRTNQRPVQVLESAPFRICMGVMAIVSGTWTYACFKRGELLPETAWMPVLPLGFLLVCWYSMQQLDVLHQHLNKMEALQYRYKKV